MDVLWKVGAFLKRSVRLMRLLITLSQLAFELIAPPLMLLFLALILQRRFSLGVWVLAVAIFAGLVSSICSAIRFYRRVMKDLRKDKSNGASFNRHE